MEQLTPEQIQAQAIALKEAFDMGAISAEQFNDGMTDVTKGVQGYADAMKASLNQLGTASKQLGEAMLKGSTGASVYNEAMQSGADTAAVALEGAFGPAGMAVGVLIKVVTYAVGQVNQMSDGLYKANQDLSKAGAAGAEGMSGIFENMQKFGYGIADLGDMGALISANSESLSKFGNTVEEGTAKLANMAKGIKNSDFQRQFMNLGMSVNDINKGIAGYVAMQTQYGMQANESIEEQTQHAAEYIQTQDKLTRMTGMSVDELQSANAKADLIEAWNAKLITMKPEQATQMRAAYAVMAKTSESAALAMAADATGFTGFNKESTQMFQATGGASAQLTRNMVKAIEAGQDGVTAGSVAAQGMADAAAGTKDYITATAALGGNAGTGGMKEFSRLASQSNGKIIKALKDANETQAAAASTANEATNQHTEMLQNQMSARDSLQETTKNGIAPVTAGMAGLATILRSIISPYGGKPTSPEIGSNLPAGGGGAMSSKDLKALGLNIKEGDVQKEGASVDPKLIELAQKIQKGGIPGFTRFNSFNDAFHNEKSPKSEHTKGLALDFALASPPSKDEGAKIVSMLKGMGASMAIDEYNNASSKSTGGHIHAQVSARDGAILSGPHSGYQPNLTMHGTEAIVPMDKLQDMIAGRQGYSSTDITSAQSKVPIISPFDDTETASIDTTQPSMFDKLLLEATERALAATEQETRSIKRLANTAA